MQCQNCKYTYNKLTTKDGMLTTKDNNCNDFIQLEDWNVIDNNKNIVPSEAYQCPKCNSVNIVLIRNYTD